MHQPHSSPHLHPSEYGSAGTPRAFPRRLHRPRPAAACALAADIAVAVACPTQAYHESSRDWDRDATWECRGPPPPQQQRQQHRDWDPRD
ncbi:hypothetical protein FIBSPDRAFT_876605 [Athelia psychrophila]|uniref:Uncharacterized protein n=1 Tax=Athelia psychrophila TaxID=1759441 RepID=A0A167WQL5_9AGAM|nr:hypothetical protein FIBSPDRAFT_876605 [Fibularhizoctonia sp. CBS 109695]